MRSLVQGAWLVVSLAAALLILGRAGCLRHVPSPKDGADPRVSLRRSRAALDRWSYPQARVLVDTGRERMLMVRARTAQVVRFYARPSGGGTAPTAVSIGLGSRQPGVQFNLRAPGLCPVMVQVTRFGAMTYVHLSALPTEP